MLSTSCKRKNTTKEDLVGEVVLRLFASHSSLHFPPSFLQGSVSQTCSGMLSWSGPGKEAGKHAVLRIKSPNLKCCSFTEQTQTWNVLKVKPAQPVRWPEMVKQLKKPTRWLKEHLGTGWVVATWLFVARTSQQRAGTTTSAGTGQAVVLASHQEPAQLSDIGGEIQEME